MLQFLGWLIIGALIGWLASKIMHGKGGLLRNIILGVAGAEPPRRRAPGSVELQQLVEEPARRVLRRDHQRDRAVHALAVGH